METLLNADRLKEMINHWLQTPVGSYVGSNYGNNLPDQLQDALSEFDADAVLAKLLADIPVLDTLPEGAIAMFAESNGIDTNRLRLQVGSLNFEL